MVVTVIILSVIITRRCSVESSTQGSGGQTGGGDIYIGGTLRRLTYFSPMFKTINRYLTFFFFSVVS